MNSAISELVWVVTEHSAAGDSVVGVFSTLEKAREVITSLAGEGRLEDFQVEGHVPDAVREEPAPWQIGLTADGELLRAEPFIGCSCSEDEEQIRKLSFIESDGQSMYVIVFAKTPGAAIEAAQRYRAWLRDGDRWSTGFAPLEPIQAY
ncbi:MAG TPA: hypothetical protein VFY10_08040 [Dehalococcoidia bacterium]|nr:hypothetical protein [Dehalococcoidia bacterium]